MSSVVFMRAVNVAGHKAFRPSALAGELADLGVINIGAAGTFVIPGRAPRRTLREKFGRRLPFEAELMIVPGSDLLDLSVKDPFPDGPELRRFVSIMSRAPVKRPRLPLCHPAAGRWDVKVIAASGRFALSLYRRSGRSFVDPNRIVEKGFGVSATTRNWNTIMKICETLREQDAK